MRNAKSRIFWAKTRRGYRYQLSGTGTGMQWEIGTDTAQTGTGHPLPVGIGTGFPLPVGTGTGLSGTGTD